MKKGSYLQSVKLLCRCNAWVSKRLIIIFTNKYLTTICWFRHKKRKEGGRIVDFYTKKNDL